MNEKGGLTYRDLLPRFEERQACCCLDPHPAAPDEPSDGVPGRAVWQLDAEENGGGGGRSFPSLERVGHCVVRAILETRVIRVVV